MTSRPEQNFFAKLHDDPEVYPHSRDSVTFSVTAAEGSGVFIQCVEDDGIALVEVNKDDFDKFIVAYVEAHGQFITQMDSFDNDPWNGVS